MKNSLKRLSQSSFSKGVVNKLVQSGLTWKLLKPVVRVCRALDHARQQFESSQGFAGLFAERTVLNGPFKGMVYPSLNAVGSQLFPKLAGSYEHELHETTEYFCSQPYSEIIDIGCAEGYYAIGLARRIAGAKVYAYDVNSEARTMCRNMALENKVEDRVFIRTFCSAEELKTFPVTRKGLIICDCEGFEKELFTEENLPNLKNFDLLIEVHDFLDINISPALEKLFSSTHDIRVIRSVDDIEKARTYNFLQQEFTLAEKQKLYAEGRPGVMEWMVCLSKTSK